MSAAALIIAVPHSLQAQLCDRPADTLPAASRDLYCMTLIGAPAVSAASGQVELARVPGPFTVNVTADGRPIYAPIVTIRGLPAPSTLGPYRAYVAWATPTTMYPTSKLGAVHNGRTTLRAVDVDPFILFITAEISAEVTRPSNRIVLRGGSPSTRLQPPDLLRFSLGALIDSSSSDGHAMHHMAGRAAGHEEHGLPDAVRWTDVPMPAGLAMLPAEMALRPSVPPYLPEMQAGELPDAAPSQIMKVAAGDTLQLVAKPVRHTLRHAPRTMFAFNGQLPGPLITVPQGATIALRLTNQLDQPTSVHWHGIRLDNAFDGVPGMTQRPIGRGDSFLYTLRFPDPGIYWYHPHLREDVQQDLGLYGNLMIRSPRPDYFGPAHREQVLMLDDVLIGENGLVPYGRTTPTHALMGRFGNVMLVNGSEHYSLQVKRGEVVRFFLTNASSARTFNLSFRGARMKLVGSDGGNYEREAWVTSVVIAPAERYIVHVRFDNPGDVALVNQVRGLDHLFGHFFPETDTLGVVHVSTTRVARALDRQFETLRRDTAATADIRRYARYFDRPADRTLVVALATHGLPFVTQQLMQLDSAFFAPVEWSGTMPNMNWASTGEQVRWVLRDPATGRENMDVDWQFRRGDVIKLRLVNERRTLHAMQHPIHIHGQRFLVLAVNGVPNDNLVWKDTVLLPAGNSVDLLVVLSNPGRWMLHCHIAEHLEAQMMTAFTVQ